MDCSSSHNRWRWALLLQGRWSNLCQCTFLLLTHLMPKNLWSECSLQRRWGRRCVYCYYEMRAVPDGRRLQYCGRTLVTGQLGLRCANIENRSFSLVATLALAGCVISSSSTGKLGGAFISQEHEGAPIYWSPYYSWFFLGVYQNFPSPLLSFPESWKQNLRAPSCSWQHISALGSDSECDWIWNSFGHKQGLRDAQHSNRATSWIEPNDQ